MQARAAKLVLEKGYTHQQAADNLGIFLSAISRWVRVERGPDVKPTVDQTSRLNLSRHTELTQLRKENKQLRMEHDILKMAVVFFVNEVD
ncbi:MAG: transposase [Methylococcales bacterium]